MKKKYFKKEKNNFKLPEINNKSVFLENEIKNNHYRKISSISPRLKKIRTK